MAKIVSLLVVGAAVASAGVARRGEEGQGWNDWSSSAAACVPTTEYSTEYSTIYSTEYSTVYSTQVSTTTEIQYSSIYVTKAVTEVQTSTIEKPVTVPTTVYETTTVEKYVTVPITVPTTIATTEYKTETVQGPTITQVATITSVEVSTYTAGCSSKWEDWSSAPAVTITETAPCPTSSGWSNWN